MPSTRLPGAGRHEEVIPGLPTAPGLPIDEAVRRAVKYPTVSLAITGTDAALYLGVYSTVISTFVALLSLYGQLFQRIAVGASEDFLVSLEGGRILVMGRDAVEEQGDIPIAATRPVLTIRVRNRGRQPVQVRTISKAYWFSVGRQIFDEPLAVLPFVVEPGQYQDVQVGVTHDFAHGELGRISRFYVVDGADRTYPLRERWLQKAEDVVYRRATIRFRRRRRRRAADRTG